jgi:hypothetical protein
MDYPRPNGIWWFGCGNDSKKDFVDSSANAHSVLNSQADSADFYGIMNDAVNSPRETIFTMVREERIATVRDNIQEETPLHNPQAQLGLSSSAQQVSSLGFLMALCLLRWLLV